VTKLQVWLAVAAAVLLAFLGVRSHYERKLARERERLLAAHEEAIRRGDNEAAAVHAARVAMLELELERQRSRPIGARVADAIREARERRYRGRVP
jgi:hypothetical protein